MLKRGQGINCCVSKENARDTGGEGTRSRCYERQRDKDRLWEAKRYSSRMARDTARFLFFSCLWCIISHDVWCASERAIVRTSFVPYERPSPNLGACKIHFFTQLWSFESADRLPSFRCLLCIASHSSFLFEAPVACMGTASASDAPKSTVFSGENTVFSRIFFPSAAPPSQPSLPSKWSSWARRLCRPTTWPLLFFLILFWKKKSCLREEK